MKAVTTTTIVNELQTLVDEIKAEKRIDLEKRVKLIYQITGRQLQAGALNLSYQRALARMAEGAAEQVPQLNAEPQPQTQPQITRQ